MADPKIAQKTPYAVDVVAGKNYSWCSCGLSSKQPFCDGAHKGSEFTPIRQSFDEDKTVYFCGCKHTNGQPLCDGSHSKL